MAKKETKVTKNNNDDEQKFSDNLEKGKKLRHYFDSAYIRGKERTESITENIAFYEGRQYLLDSYQASKPWVIQMNTPHATMAIDIRIASLVANDYVGELEPYSADDKEKLETLKLLYEDMWEELDMNNTVNKSIASAAVVREAYIHIIADPKKITGSTNTRNRGQIKAYAIEPTHVWLDPKARSFSDCRYICITERIDKDVAFRKYPYLKDRVTGGAYSIEERGEIVVGNDYTTSQEDVFTKVILYVKEYNKNNKQEIKRYTLIEDVLVDEQTLSGLKHFPIAQLKWKSSSDSPYGISLMDELITLQKAVNAIESAITNTALSYASPAMMVSSTCGVDPTEVALASGAPGVIFVVNGDLDNAIKTVTAPQINDRIVNIKTEYENTISTIAGVTSTYLGSIGTAGNTAGGTELAINRAKIIENIVLRNVEIFVEQLTRIITDYIIALWKDEKVVYTRTRGDNGDIIFNKRALAEGIDDVDFSFYIDLSTRTQFSKEKEKQTLQELYQMERQYKSDYKVINEIDILDETDLRCKEAIKRRYKRMVSTDAEQKVGIILSLSELQTKFNIDPNLIMQAQTEVMNNDEQMQAFKQVQQIAEQTQAQMNQAMQQANEQAVQLGIPQQAVQQASQQIQEQGLTANMFNLG